jgi:hypothetical protein
MLLVVRHADAGSKRTWKGPDRLRPLSRADTSRPKGSTWLLERVDRRQVRGRFLAPLVHNGEITLNR